MVHMIKYDMVRYICRNLCNKGIPNVPTYLMYLWSNYYEPVYVNAIVA